NQHSMTNARCAPISAPVTQGHPMINRAIFTDDCGRVHDDAAEVMNAETFADRDFGGNRYAGYHLDKSLAKKPNGLRGETPFMEPAENAIHKQRLESLRKQSANQCA